MPGRHWSAMVLVAGLFPWLANVLNDAVPSYCRLRSTYVFSGREEASEAECRARVDVVHRYLEKTCRPTPNWHLAWLSFDHSPVGRWP